MSDLLYSDTERSIAGQGVRRLVSRTGAHRKRLTGIYDAASQDFSGCLAYAGGRARDGRPYWRPSSSVGAGAKRS